jgi:hypothetical protein
VKTIVAMERTAQPVAEETAPVRVVVVERLATADRDLKPKPVPAEPAHVRHADLPAPAKTDAPRPVTEPLAQRIATEVVTFRRLGTQSVDVSVRPDNQTELSLHLTLNRGQVEVTARVEQGDLQVLKSHWPEVQQTLAQQGIRVHHLSEPSAGQGGLTFSDRQQRRFAPEPEPEPAFVGAATEPVGKRASRKAARGWEVWA